MCIGIVPVSLLATSASALSIPKYAAFDFLEVAT